MTEVLTGNTRYRVSWTGKIILQVEYSDGSPWKNWKDAKVEDLNSKLCFSKIFYKQGE